MAPGIWNQQAESLETSPAVHRAWWKESSVYQIYPASFKDSNDDGIGDLPGITSKLDYIKQLGVDIVWLCPAYKSPKVDMGYDISDYRDIDEQYGTLEDVDVLIAGLHERGLKFLMDLVVNHTSDQHDWFRQSRSSKNNEYRDWYIWRTPRYDADGNRHPPNNWASYFQGSAWEYDQGTGEYYLHIFCKEQPDLNWDHPPVRHAVHEIMRFWLDRGVDGFRMDVINYISKFPGLPDAPITDPTTQWQPGDMYYAAGPRLHEYLQDLGQILKEYNAFSVGEMPFVRDCNEVLKSVRHDRGELNMIFQFDMYRFPHLGIFTSDNRFRNSVDIDHGPGGKFTPKSWLLTELKGLVEKWQTFMQTNGGWNALYLENHDQSRTVDRFTCGCAEHRHHSAKMLATFLGFQAGTVFVYQGQELAMGNVPKEWGMEEYKDVDCLNHWNEISNAGTNNPEALAIARTEYQKKSRDNARTPMQWNTKPNGGFTSASTKPWMRVNPCYKTINAESQVSDSTSTFHYWASVLALRKEYKEFFVYGKFKMLDWNNEKVIAYTRESGGRDSQKALVLCNWSAEEVSWDSKVGKAKKVLLCNYGGVGSRFSDLKWILRPYEACVLLLD